MQNSVNTLRRSGFWVGELLSPQFALLRHLTVRLAGTVHAGNLFNGTGVIARINGNQTFVVTAKHNLHVAGEPAKLGNDKVVANFVDKVKVQFTSTADPAKPVVTAAAIAAVTLPDNNTANQGYDVAVLRVDDAKLANAVRAAIPNTSPMHQFTAQDWRNGGPSILTLRPRNEARSVLMNGRPFQGQNNTDDAEWVLLQFGFGLLSRTSGENPLSFRVLRIKDLKNGTYIERSADPHEDVFTFDTTDAETTTWKGDSGGPAFAFSPAGTDCFLVGTTLGANIYRDRVDNDENSATTNNAFTVVSTDRRLFG